MSIVQEEYSTPLENRSKRCLSYNDLKKKRLIRSEHSKSKLKQYQDRQSSTKTEKKTHQTNYKNILNTIPQDEIVIESCISALKNSLSELRQKIYSKKGVFLKQYHTDRVSNISDRYQSIKIETSKHFQQQNHPKISFYKSIEEAGTSKEIIKQLIQKNKSQRRLLKFHQIRDKLKIEKSRSKSKSSSKIYQKIHKNNHEVSYNKNTSIIKNNSLLESVKNISNPVCSSKKQKQNITPNKSPNTKYRLSRYELIPENTNEKLEVLELTQKKNQTKSQKYLINQVIKNQKELHFIQKERYQVLERKNGRKRLKSSKSVRQILIKHQQKKLENSKNEYKTIGIEKSESNLKSLNEKEVQECKKGVQQWRREKDVLSMESNFESDFQNKKQNININSSGLFNCSQASSIKIHKESNFLGESCENVIQDLDNEEINDEKILDLLKVPTKDFKKMEKSKQKRRKLELQKLNKIFPKDFFNL